MRRALLTLAAPPPVPPSPLYVGNPAVVGTSFFNNTTRFLLDQSTPATGSGTLTNLDVYTETAGTVYVMTGTVSGTNFTVRAVSGALSAASVGLNSFNGLSLPVVAGDYIALYMPSGGGATIRLTGTSGTRASNTTTSAVPNPSDVISFSTGAGKISVFASNGSLFSLGTTLGLTGGSGYAGSYDANDPSPMTGYLKSVIMRGASGGGNIVVFTVTHATRVVKSVSEVFAIGAGGPTSYTLATPLPIAAGDCWGWAATAGTINYAYNDVSFSGRAEQLWVSTMNPTVGVALSAPIGVMGATGALIKYAAGVGL